jgi:hypothetical protein
VRGIDFKSENFRSEMALAQEATFLAPNRKTSRQGVV